MYCCSNCFSDKFLKKYIADNGIQKSECSFCGADNIPVVDPKILSDLFLPLIDLYAVCSVETGMSLNEQIQNDWDVFTITDRSVWLKLLIAISGDETLERKKYQPINSPDKDIIAQWNEFREELKHTNRFFPKKIPDMEHLQRLFEFLQLPEDFLPKEFYRARINIKNKSFSISEMGKPSELNVANGRANPIGIPYLYMASDLETAIAEVSPHKGETLTVAKLKSNSSLILADLRNPKRTISPFELYDDSLILVFTNMQYLAHLGEELSKPVVPREAELEYLPSQYLCEFVKSIKFDGIIYKSSLSYGDNYAIFDDEKIDVIEAENYKITNTEVKAEKC